MFRSRTSPGFPHWNNQDLTPGDLVTVVTTAFSGTAVIKSVHCTTEVVIVPSDCYDYNGTPIVSREEYWVTNQTITSVWERPRSWKDARNASA